MLQFIVLGLIPGTHLQLTFTGLLLVAWLVAVAVLIKIEMPRLNKWRAEHGKQSDLSTS